MNIRDRTIEVRVMQPGELAPNALNWVSHPPEQRDALRGILAEIGIVDDLLAYYSERNGGALTLIDGHMRIEEGDTPWPVRILDLDDAEADKLLALLRPVGALAQQDAEAYQRLIREIDTLNPALQQLIATTADMLGIPGLLPGEPDLSLFNGAGDAELWYRLVVNGLTLEQAEDLKATIPNARIEQYRD